MLIYIVCLIFYLLKKMICVCKSVGAEYVTRQTNSLTMQILLHAISLIDLCNVSKILLFCSLIKCFSQQPQNKAMQISQNKILIWFLMSSIKEHINTSIDISENTMEYFLKNLNCFCFLVKQ